ncbi:MAG: alpha/beta hydrolase [Burkholderiaceae bacterium]
MKRRNALLLMTASLPAACTFLRSDNVPIHQIFDTLPGNPEQRTLLIFLPGLLDYAEDFDRYGFNQTVRAARLPIDMISVDANLHYFQNGSIVERIVNDVIEPARQRGYRRIWLAGISLGGLGAMLVASSFAGLDGLISIAPFLGRESSLAEIKAAGGHANWQPTPASKMLQWERDLHLWLKMSLSGAADPSSADKTRIILGYARQDRYAVEQRELAAKLPPNDVITVDGQHDWPAWQHIWQQIINKHGMMIAGFSDRHPEPLSATRRSPS